MKNLHLAGIMALLFFAGLAAQISPPEAVACEHGEFPDKFNEVKSLISTELYVQAKDECDNGVNNLSTQTRTAYLNYLSHVQGVINDLSDHPTKAEVQGAVIELQGYVNDMEQYTKEQFGYY